MNKTGSQIDLNGRKVVESLDFCGYILTMLLFDIYHYKLVSNLDERCVYNIFMSHARKCFSNYGMRLN